jgi:ISXO2-like transposase domain
MAKVGMEPEAYAGKIVKVDETHISPLEGVSKKLGGGTDKNTVL